VPLAPQPGWRFKGFKFYTVQDLVVETCATGGGLGQFPRRKAVLPV
jgi:hypothetical protein